MVSLRDSTESIDTENVLLPLLERLGIQVPRYLYAENVLSGEEEDDQDEVVYHVQDEEFCVLVEERLDHPTRDSHPSTHDGGLLQDCTNSGRNPSSPLYDGAMSHAAFTKQRHELAKKMYTRYNDVIFDGALPVHLDISWNGRLFTTAGLTHYKKDASDVYSARIELSTKVLDTAVKLERTLIHEMCHCATWLIDHVARPPHGEHFKKYAARAMVVVPHVNVSTCHNYDIFYPFRWQCRSCMKEYGRHSKSIDVTTKVCGRCSGMLVFLGRFSRDGSPQKYTVSAYSVYVKDNFSRVKESLGPGRISASDVMKQIAEEWRSTQADTRVYKNAITTTTTV